jgi:glycosyltransferase involved in cell wall biosynthesis
MNGDLGVFRVLYINKYASFPPLESGTHRSYYLMSELAKREFRIDFVTSYTSHLTPRLEKPRLSLTSNLNIFFIKVPSYKKPSGFLRALGWLIFEVKVLFKISFSRKKYDCVIASSPSILSLLSGIFLSKLKHSKLIVEIRDIWPLTLTEEGGFSKKSLLIRIMNQIERFAYVKAEVIVGTMPNLEEHIETVTKKHQKVTCIPMGVTEELCVRSFRFEKGMLNGFSFHDSFVIAYAGTLGSTNPLDDLFEVAEEFLSDAKIKFLVIGGGSKLETLRDSYKDLSNVFFAGPKSREETLCILNKCSVLYFATYDSKIWRFGQSLNKVLDYMLSARPMIGSYSGFPSMINEAKCGVLVAPGDKVALKKAIDNLRKLDKVSLDSMGVRGKEWLCANRKYASLGDKYAEILRELKR